MALVETYFCAERAEATDSAPASYIVTEKAFHAAHWSSGNGKVIPKGKSPSDPTPVEHEVALELMNRWNRHSESGQSGGKVVKYWIR